MKKMTVLAAVLGVSVLIGGCGIQESEGRITRVVQEYATGDVVYEMEANAPKQNEAAVQTEMPKQSEPEVQTEAARQGGTEVQTEALRQSEPEVQTEAPRQSEPEVQTEAPRQTGPEGQTEAAKQSRPEVQTEMQTDEHGRISKEKAIAIVLSKIPGASEADVHIKLDMDDGHWEYEGEVYYNFREYEFEINAMNGKILEWSEDD